MTDREAYHSTLAEEWTSRFEGVSEQSALAEVRFLLLPLGLLTGLTAIFVTILLFLFGFHVIGSSELTHAQRINVLQKLAIVNSIVFAMSGLVIWAGWKGVRDHRAYLAQFRTSELPERAKRAAQALHEAITLVEELRAELDARTALLHDLTRDAEEQRQQAHDIAVLDQMDAETADSVNRLIDRMLQRRLSDLERGTKRREWLLATVVSGLVALVMGVLATLLVQHL